MLLIFQWLGRSLSAVPLHEVFVGNSSTKIRLRCSICGARLRDETLEHCPNCQEPLPPAARQEQPEIPGVSSAVSTEVIEAPLPETAPAASNGFTAETAVAVETDPSLPERIVEGLRPRMVVLMDDGNSQPKDRSSLIASLLAIAITVISTLAYILWPR